MNLQKKPLLQHRLLLEEYYERDLEEIFDMRLKGARQDLENKTSSHLSKSLNSFLIDEQEYSFVHFRMSNTKHKTIKAFPSEKILKSLIKMFLTRYLYYYSTGISIETMYGQENLMKSNESQLFLQLALPYSKDDFFIQTQLLLIRFTHSKSKESLGELLKLMQSAHFKEMNTEERKSLLTTTVNYVQKLYVKGDESKLTELLKLLDFALEHKGPFRKGNISDSFFLNYVFMNITAGQFQKAEIFFNEQGAFLHHKTAKNTLNYALSNLEFAKKNYAKALQHLNQVTPTNPQRFLGIKNLTLKIHFETEEFEHINGVIDTIRHKLINEEYFSKENIQSEKNFLKFLLPLVNTLSKGKKNKQQEMSTLLTTLKKTEFVFQKDWLISKISNHK